MNIYFLLFYILGLIVLLCTSTNKFYSGFDILPDHFVLGRQIKLKTIAVTIIIVSMGFLCATRSMESYDTFVYVPWYEQIQALPLLQFNGQYGFCFELLAKVVAKVFHGSYQVFFFAVAAINLIVVYEAIIKVDIRNNSPLLSYVLYLVFIGFYYSFIVLRQGLAMTMVIAAYCYLDKSKIKALLLCAIGSLFHESALIAFICIFVFYNSRTKLRQSLAYILLLLSLFLYISHGTTRYIVPILQTILNMLNLVDAFTFHKYSLYFETETLSDGVSLLYILYYILTIGIVFVLYSLKSYEKTLVSKERFFLTINILGLSIIGFFSAAEAITRLTEYMVSCTYIFLIPACLNRVMCQRDSKIITALVATVITILHLRIMLVPIDIHL